MKRKQIVSLAIMAIVAVGILSAAACKSSGTAVTSRGQVLRLSIEHPTDLPDSGEDNLDILVANRGVNNVEDVLVDVTLPPQIVVLDQTNERGVEVTRDSMNPNTYHFVFGNVQPAETSRIRFKVRTTFGNLRETGKVEATAWQRDLPGDKLVESAVIKLRQ